MNPPRNVANYPVEGMTCEHCRTSVLANVVAIPEVVEADVDLETGLLEVQGAQIDDAAVEAAVVEAGYRLGDRW